MGIKDTVSGDNPDSNLDSEADIPNGSCPRDDAENCIKHPGDVIRNNPDIDGGWGYVVVLGSGLSFAIGAGLNRSFGLVYDGLLDRYHQPAAITAWVPALNGVFKMSTAPLISGLCTKYGHRIVVIAGGFISFAGLLGSAFAPSIVYQFLTLSILAAIGHNMLFTPALSMIAQMFVEKRAKANAIATVFNGIGGLTLGPLIQMLFYEYGFTGALSIVGALTLNYCVTGALLRPIRTESLLQPIRVENEKSLIQTCDKDTCIRENNHRPTFSTDAEKDETENSFFKQINSIDVERKSRFVRLAEFFDLALLKNARFSFFCILMGVLFFVLDITGTFLSAIAREMGYTRAQIALIFVIFNSVDVTFRLVTGVLFDTRLLRPHRLLAFGFLGITIGISTIVLPLAMKHSVALGLIMWGVSQMPRASFHCLHVTVLSDLVDRGRVTNALGLTRFCQGIGMLLGGSIGGLLKDLSGTYATPYYTAGGVMLLASSAFFIWSLTYKAKLTMKTKK